MLIIRTRAVAVIIQAVSAGSILTGAVSAEAAVANVAAAAAIKPIDARRADAIVVMVVPPRIDVFTRLEPYPS